MNFILAFLSFLMVAAAAPVNLLEASNITKPTDDPFYVPPPGYENLTLGTIINHREIFHPYGVIKWSVPLKAAYQLLVRSEDSFGNPNAIVTTVLVPPNADPKKILSYQTAEDSNSINCAPSYASQIGSDPGSWFSTQVEQWLSHPALYEGWYLVIPDHLGPKSAWMVGLQAGYAVLNSIKAVLNSGDITGVDKNARVAFQGYSGGTQPSNFGAALAPTYFPELNLVGVAVGGAVVDPLSMCDSSTGKLWANLILVTLNGFANEDPDFMNFLKQNLYPDVQKAVFADDDRCLVEATAATVFFTWDDLFPQGAAIRNQTEFAKMFHDNNLLNFAPIPKAPFFLYNGKYDEIVPVGPANQLYDKWCGQNVSVEYHQDTLSEHVTEAIFGGGEAFEWLKDRINGKPQTGCNRKNVFSNALSPSGLLGSATLIADIDKSVRKSPSSNSTKSSSLLGSILNGVVGLLK